MDARCCGSANPLRTSAVHSTLYLVTGMCIPLMEMVADAVT